MYIDCHVHCRDFKQNYKETIEHALEVARDSGLSGIFDMPNTNPPVTTRERVLERFALIGTKSIFYGIYIGLTSDKEQITEAVETYNEFFPSNPEIRRGVVGLKMFAGRSVGDLAIIELEEQVEVYNQLSNLNYMGVLAVHCEKESEMYPRLWDSSKPSSHSLSRPEISEMESVKDQIEFARKSSYKGHLHVLHASIPESVSLVFNAKKDLRISCGVTPHHLLLNNQIEDIMYQVNPPLRKPTSQELLFELFRNGKIDILETDHAPHTREEKLEGMSGIPNLASWPVFLDILKRRGIKEELIDKVAFENVNEIFQTQIPRRKFPLKSHLKDYAYSPYEHLER